MDKESLKHFFKENHDVAKMFDIDHTQELPMVSKIIGHLMNYDDGKSFFEWAKAHKSTAHHVCQHNVRIPHPSLMDYDSMESGGAYNTRMIYGELNNTDLKGIDHKKYNKSELPVNDKRFMKN